MATRQTIAVIGAEEENTASMAAGIASGPYRLLLVSEGEIIRKINDLPDNIKEVLPEAEVEVMDCARDGCWEADIILIAGPGLTDQRLAEKIWEVATRKIVACIYFSPDALPAGTDPEKALKESLPHSRVLEAILDRRTGEAEVSGEDPEAMEILTGLLNTAGYSFRKTGNAPFKTNSPI